MFSPLSLVLGVATASFTLALTLPSTGNLAVRTIDPAQDSRSCLSLRDLCNSANLSDPHNPFSIPACIALVVCETPSFFTNDFARPQVRLSREEFNAASTGSQVLSQQEFIDFYYGTIASINATNATIKPEFPSSVDSVIAWWQVVVAWTGNCATGNVPYNNFADWIQFSDSPGVCGAVQSCDAATNAGLQACVPQRATDNGSCAEMVSQCSVVAGPSSPIFSIQYCVLAAFCFSQSTIDVLINQLLQGLHIKPILSAQQPRLTEAEFNKLSNGKSVVSQQDVIDAYYGALTNTIHSCGGPIGAETPCPTGTSGPYPTDASYVIDFWTTVSAWTGFCSTREIPYKNLADYLQFSSTVKAATSC